MIKKSILVVSLLALSTSITALASDNSTDLTTNIFIQEVIHGKWSSVANSESSKPINNSKQWKEASELYTNQFSSKY